MIEKLKTMVMSIIAFVSTAWQPKILLLGQTIIGAVVTTVYGLDIEPVIALIDDFWKQAVGIIAALGLTGIGKNKGEQNAKSE